MYFIPMPVFICAYSTNCALFMFSCSALRFSGFQTWVFASNRLSSLMVSLVACSPNVFNTFFRIFSSLLLEGFPIALMMSIQMTEKVHHTIVSFPFTLLFFHTQLKPWFNLKPIGYFLFSIRFRIKTPFQTSFLFHPLSTLKMHCVIVGSNATSGTFRL